MDEKAGRTIGEALSKFTRLDRAQVTGASMGSASAFTMPPLVIKDALIPPGMVPTVGVGRGDT